MTATTPGGPHQRGQIPEPAGEGQAGLAGAGPRAGTSAAIDAAPIPNTALSPGRRIHHGRPVITGGEFARRVGVARSTTAAWYRQRTTNGHPDPVVRIGRRLYFDENTVLDWARSQLQPEPPPARITHRGRVLVTRAELARLTGLSESALANFHSQRRTSGHPPAVRCDRRWLYFDETDALAWHATRGAAKRATLTDIDRSGDPDQLLDRTDAARLLGYSGPKVIDSYRARNKGYFPDPDATGPLRWHRATLWAFADRRSRPGRAGHPQP